MDKNSVKALAFLDQQISDLEQKIRNTIDTEEDIQNAIFYLEEIEKDCIKDMKQLTSKRKNKLSIPEYFHYIDILACFVGSMHIRKKIYEHLITKED